MPSLKGVVSSTRFLSIALHMIYLVSVFVTQMDDHVKTCLPHMYAKEKYDAKKLEFLSDLAWSMFCILLEACGVLCSIALYNPKVALYSIASHSLSILALAYLTLNAWDCHLYHWLYFCGTALPAIVEVFATIISAFIRLKFF